ncbi:uncharacterized protein BDV17DRAFT_252443 [Aspergillus undulatus]|uniref:uncharacterized protein n=1 Tax=Aspergillus undulatus TaxID=1810928 RepID=UPI003CCCF324
MDDIEEAIHNSSFVNPSLMLLLFCCRVVGGVLRRISTQSARKGGSGTFSILSQPRYLRTTLFKVNETIGLIDNGNQNNRPSHCFIADCFHSLLPIEY